MTSTMIAPRTVRARTFVVAFVLVFFALAIPASAFHFFRGDERGGCSAAIAPVGGGPARQCCPATGEISDDPGGVHGPLGATVAVAHNTFNDLASGTPITVIQAGQSVRWQWFSSHCHSVQSTDANPTSANGNFYSGFRYPTNPPEGEPIVAPGLFDYPVPDTTPDLTFVHTFSQPGVYDYRCEHHWEIGMVGVVLVQ